MAWLARDRYSTTIPNRFTHQESIMKVRKNLEAVFLAAAVMTTFAAYATAEVPVARSTASASATGKVAVVVVKAKRLTAVEKAALN
jgi:hypothetical protein